MLFYDKNGKLRKIDKLDFCNDKLYYEYIIKTKIYVPHQVKFQTEYPVEKQLINLI